MYSLLFVFEALNGHNIPLVVAIPACLFLPILTVPPLLLCDLLLFGRLLDHYTIRQIRGGRTLWIPMTLVTSTSVLLHVAVAMLVTVNLAGVSIAGTYGLLVGIHKSWKSTNWKVLSHCQQTYRTISTVTALREAVLHKY